MMLLHVTDHARDRWHERTGLPKRCVRRMAERAWLRGVDADQVTGDLRLYLLGQRNRRHPGQRASDPRAVAKLFQGVVFIFVEQSLVTCWPLPPTLVQEAA